MKTYCKCLLFVFFTLTAYTFYGQNPIIDLVNTPNNDVDGEVTLCANDGSNLPKIFLCGENDVAPLTVNYPGAVGIDWQQLDEGSCTNFGDNCSNKSQTCQYTTITSGNSFSVGDAGKYRLVVDEGNGVSTIHYFHVFQNNLEVEYLKADIGCEPTGNITITNLGNTYGFQLVNADTDQILIPFSAGNGPAFTITANGNYRVEVTQLNPLTGNPIANGCIFSTPDVAIGTSNFQVQGSATEADCAGVGTVTADLSGGSPSYTYELRLNDGLDGGRGTLIDVVTNVAPNSYTFTGVGQGEYVVVGINSDGCEQSDLATVVSGSDSTLSFESRVSQHITCKEGNILVDPSGGKPPYRYAIWQNIDESNNVVTSYNSPSEIPSSEFQTREIFDILTPGNYTFVVIDRLGCFTTSNSVDIEFVPPAEFADATIIDQICFGDPTGSIRMNLIDDGGYQLTYYLFNGTIPQQNVFDGNFDLANAIDFNSSGYFPGLIAGDYTMIINMRKGSASCDYPYYHTINGPPSALAGEAILIQPFSCSQTGTIRANNYGGGIAPYEFSLDGANWQADDMFIGLQPGPYTIFVRDDSGCVIETNPVEILPVDEPDDLEFATTQITCADPTSDLTVTAIGGTAPFTVQIISPSTQAPTSLTNNVAVFENLAPNTYILEVIDVNDCSYTESYTILPITPIGVVGNLNNNVSCDGANDGALTYTVAGFDTTFSYVVVNGSGTTIDSGTGVNTTTIALNNLTGEDYTIIVTDDVTTCEATANVLIGAPATPLSATIVVTDLGCTATGTNPGSVTINATGGWGNYSFELTDPLGTTQGPQAVNIFSGLTDTSGTYTVTITDGGGCETTDTFSLTPIDLPVLELVPNNPCYDDITGLTLTANVTSGGDGDFRYRLNGGGYTTNNVFNGLAPGTYTVDVIDGRNCTATQTITVDPQMSVSATTRPIAACETSTDVVITASGGDGNFVYAVVTSGTTPAAGDFGVSSTIAINMAGNYDVYVRDNGGNVEYCEATDVVTITQNPTLQMNVTIDPQVIPCAGTNNGSISIAPTGGAAPYLFSIDGGTTFGTQSTFVNLASGDYAIVVLDNNGCEVSEIHNIPETFTLSASAAVTQSPTCNPALGTEVRILNAQGGTQAYEYSFDGGNTYGASNSAFLQPGTHLLFLRDANGCTFEMSVTIDPIPDNPTFIHDVTYDCTGQGTVTVTPSSTDFDYTYTLDGTLNTPSDSNIFTGVAPGFHTVTVDYLPSTPLAPSVLLSETFGSGANTAISEVDPVYCYEPQNGTDNGCPHASAINRINDGEYSVTQSIVSPFGTWIDPNDHTGDTNGRYLAMNVGDVAGTLGIIYAKRNITVVANRDIDISLWAINLLRQGTSGADPNVLIELVDGLGNSIASTTTGNIPKSTGPDDWRNYSVTLNPGANTTLDIVIRTNSIVIGGNDIAVDDIQATQAAEDCPQQEVFQVFVEDGRALTATVTAQINPLCVGDTNGAITFEVENFDVTGFIYSTDGGTTFSAPQTTSPVTINNLAAGTYDIVIQDASNAACSTSLTVTLTDPAPLVTTATLTQQMSCTNMTAIITAAATGGTPGYEYQLENAAAVVITPFQTSTTFAVNAAGDYVIRARDANGCEDLTDTPITINEPETVVFSTTPSNCYSGNNDATIQVDVTAGNGNYQFQIDNGPWITPNPATVTTYTFGSLPSGSYTINVKDGFGCIGTAEIVTIDPVLSALVDVTEISACVDGAITVTASGGDGNYVYAYVPTGNSPAGTFGASNTFAVSAANSGTYDVYVRDNAGNTPYCQYLQTVTLDPPIALSFTATPEDPQCNGENGQITVVVTTGELPYDMEVRDLNNGGVVVATYNDQLQATRTFYNLAPGNYEVVVTDGDGCALNQAPIAINDPDPLTADINPILPAACDDPNALNYGFEFINYPTTLNGTLQFSNDGGLSWSTNDTFMGHISGSSVFPSIRTVDALGNTLCRLDFPRYIIPYPLDELNITVLPQIANCVELLVSVQGSEGIPPYEYTYTDNPANFDPLTATWDGPFVATVVHQYTGLIPGRTYVFYVRDSAGCIRQSSVNVNDLVANPFDITGTFEPSCFGANDGSIDFTIVNNSGTTYPQMHWEFYDLNTGLIVQQSPGNVPWTGTLLFNNLPPSEYYVVVTGVDATNTDQCVTGSENQLIIEQQAITADLSGEDMTCSTPGYIFIENISGGGGSYTFNVTGPAGFTAITGTTANPIEIAANSPSGTYTVQVVDQYDCDFTDTVGLVLPANPTIDNVAIDNCADPSTVTITASGPSANFVYSLDGGVTYVDNGGIFTNVAAGPYTIFVRDGNGCTATENITVHPILQGRAELTKLLDCTVSPDAEITIEALQGSGDYDITINDGTVDVVPRTAMATNPYVFATPNDGTYTVTLWDNDTDPNCFRELVVEVPVLVEPAFTPDPVDVTCFGGNDGAIIVNELDLGIGPISYVLTPAVDPYNVATGRFENLPQGTYSITATAANSCSNTINNIVVGQPAQIMVQDPVVVPFACSAGNTPTNATIIVDATTITGGSGTYLVYEFINDGTAAVVQRGTLTTYVETDLAGGNYTINVYDDNGCLGTTTATIEPYDQLIDATINVTPVSCVPGNDGGLAVTVNSTLGNTALFEYSLDNGATYQPSNVFSNLTAGNYLVTVRHTDTQCIITANATIEEPNTFEIEVDVQQDVVCFGTDTGEVTLQFTDATYGGSFSYTVFDMNGTPADDTDDISVATGSESVNTTTAVITLGAGSYRVVAIQDAAPQCTQETVFSVGTPSAAITGLARETDITCNPGNDGIIEIYDVEGGWGGYSYYVGTIPPVDASSFVATPRFENLVAGTYEAWVIDNRGCQQLIQDNIVLEDTTPITATLQVNSENCTGTDGELEVINIVGGQGSNYTLQLIKDGTDFGAPQTTTLFSGLGAGSYEVRITDQWDCTVTIGPEVFYEPMVATYDIVQTIDCDADGEITVTVTGGSGNFEYRLLLPGGTTQTNTTGVFTGLNHAGNAPADYVFTIIDLDTDPQCSTPVTVTLDKPTPVTLLTTDGTDLSCPGADDGTITINLEPTTDGVNDNPIYIFTIENTTVGSAPVTQDNPLFSSLAPGVYDITVTSGRGCEATDQVEILSPVPLDAAITDVVPFSCDMDNAIQMAQIEVTITTGTGTPDYYYSVNNSPFLPTNGEVFVHTVTTDGAYDIVVRDANGCLFALPTQNIDPLPQIVLSIAEGTTDCTLGQEITITSTGHATNPSVDLSFEVLETGTVQNNTTTGIETFYVLDSGQYTIQVTDNTTGCYEFINYTVPTRPDWDVAITASTPVLCFGDANSTLEVTFTGYSGVYDYEVFNEDGTAAVARVNGETIHPLTIVNMPAGNYFVRVWPTEYPYCEDKETLVETIVSPDAELLPVTNSELQAGCTNDLGEISVVPEGGYAPYDIVLTHSGGQQYTATDVFSEVFIGLPSGSYTIMVTDAEGCVWNGAETVDPTPPISASATGTAPICFTDPDGTIEVTATGGSGSYNYFINYYDPTGSTIEFTPEVPQRANEFNNLGEGYYSITVVDNLGCTDTTNIVHLDGPDQLIAEIALVTPMTCVDPAVVTVTATGGTAPYEYFNTTTSAWEPFNQLSGAGQHSINVATSGTYYAQIRDANGCEAITQVPVVVPMVPPVQLRIDYASESVTCADDMTASIYASAIGGIGQYTYELVLGGAVVATQTQPDAVFENIAPGAYTVRVTSEGGCPPDELPVSIANPAPLIFTYDVQDVSCTDEEDGAITLMLAGGGGGYQFAISPNLNQFFDEDLDQGLPAGQYRFEDLTPGTYTLIAQDLNGCFFVEELTIANPTPIAISLDNVVPEACVGDANGFATISISGGTPPYRTAFNSNEAADFTDLGDNITFNGLPQGTYFVFVRDANDCEMNSIVEVEGGVNLNATVIPIYKCTANVPTNYLEIVFEDPTVLGDVMYALDLADPNDTSGMRLDANFTNLTPGPHTLSIASVSTGCVVIYDFVIESFEPLELTLENNNLNEITALVTGGLPPYTYYFEGIPSASSSYYIYRDGLYTVRVVDSNGCEASAQIEMEFIDIEIPEFFTPDGDGLNDFWTPVNIEQYPDIVIKIYDRYGRVVEELTANVQGWDGLYNTKPLPTGDYWYVVQLNIEGNNREYVGHFTLFR